MYVNAVDMWRLMSCVIMYPCGASLFVEQGSRRQYDDDQRGGPRRHYDDDRDDRGSPRRDEGRAWQRYTHTHTHTCSPLGSTKDFPFALSSLGMIEMAVVVLGAPLPHEARRPSSSSSQHRERRAGRWWVGNADPRRCC